MKLFKNLNRRERTWILLGIIVLLLAGLDRLVLTPVKDKSTQIEALVRVQRKELAAYRRLAAREQEVKQEYEKLSPFLQTPESDEKEASKILDTLDALRRLSGVKLINTNPRQPVSEGWYKMFRVDLQAEATMEQLASFLYRLNTTPEALRAEQIQIGVKGGEDSSVVRALITVTKMTGTTGRAPAPDA
jgi:type II secretory pathway component PulM